MEACSFYVIVGNEDSFDFMYDTPLPARSQTHSKVLVITDSDLAWYPDYADVDEHYERQIFYYFSSNAQFDSYIFPNSFVDFFDTANDSVLVSGIRSRSEYSVHDNEPRPTIRRIPFINYVRVDDAYKYNNSYRDWLTKPCSDKKPMIIYGDGDLTPCYESERLLVALQSKFNLTLTWDEDIKIWEKSIGQVLIDQSTVNYSRNEYIRFSEATSFYSLWKITFFYCLPKHEENLLTFNALVCPFDIITWMTLLIMLFILICVNLHPVSVKEVGEKVLYICRTMFEQSLSLKNFIAVIVWFSLFVLIALYKTELTSQMIVPRDVKPINNISLLVSEGFKYISDDNDDYEMLLDYLAQANLQFLAPTLGKSEHHFVAYSFEAAQTMFNKTLRTDNLDDRQIPNLLLGLNTMLINMSCFALDKKLGYFWGSFTYFHPLQKRMKYFTTMMSESGIIVNFKSLYEYTDYIRFQSPSAEWRSMQSIDDGEEKLYIKYQESKPLLVAWLVLNCAAILWFTLYELLGILICFKVHYYYYIVRHFYKSFFYI